MARKTLTDRGIKSFKPQGRPYIEPDPEVPGHGVRIMPSGRRTFVLTARYPGFRHPAPRALGAYGVLSLEKARTKARAWRELIAAGVDPSVAEERERVAERARRANTFGSIAEDFIAEKLAKERKGKEVEKDIRRDLLPLWQKLPATDITDDQVAAVIRKKARDAPAQARNLLGTVKRLFQWAIDQRAYGLKHSSAALLKPTALCGEKNKRARILSDDELFALWRGADRIGYPCGSVYQLLALTGLRLNEAADASKGEFDHTKKIWTIPAERMKGKDGDAQPHAVPLTPDILALLDDLPEFKGDYLFTTTAGKKPTYVSTKIKRQLGARMLRTLRALARRRGDDPAKIKLLHWINHDIRRTVRSALSRLKVAEEVREAVLAHARPGIKGVYDLYDYLDEKREALELWNARLRSIVEPPPSNVVELTARAGA